MKNGVFHQASIAGLTFEAILSADGPYLSCHQGGGLAFGIPGLRQFQPPAETARFGRAF